MRFGSVPTRKPANANPITLGIIFVIVGGAIFFLFALPPLQYAGTSKSWPSVDGIITRSDIDVFRDDGNTHYQPDIAYSYTVDGKKFSSAKITVGEPPLDNNVNTAKRLQVKYPVGKEVLVYFDPELPESSALEPGIKTGDIMLASLSVLFFVIGLFAFYQGLKAKRRLKDSKPTN